jgi:hypothetical protein
MRPALDHSKATTTRWNITRTDTQSCQRAWIEGPASDFIRGLAITTSDALSRD